MTLDRSTALLCALFASLTLTAADCQTDDDDDATDDPSGCITVSGGGVFESLQEAIDAATSGATITVDCGDDVFEESLTINKALTLAGPGGVEDLDADGMPDSLAADAPLVTGAGAGTVLEIDQPDGPVSISGLAFQVPYEEIGTIRGLRISAAADVLLHDVYVGFAADQGTCDHGLVGVDVTSSGVRLSDSVIQCVGYTSETGGTGILAQTNSTLTVEGSNIEFTGSFGIRSTDTTVSIADSRVAFINRPQSAEQFDRDGTGVYIETATEPVVMENSTVEGPGVFGLFVEQGPGATVTTSTFQSSLLYGVVMIGGDQAAAASRDLTVTGSTFTDMGWDAILSYASTTVTGSTIETATAIPTPNGDYPRASGINVAAPGAEADISGNVLTGLGTYGILVSGNNTDGNLASASVVGNTIDGVTGGAGILMQLTDAATISDNVVANVDHAYNDDPDNLGAITNGYGIANFFVTQVTLEGNDVSDAEFANYVIVSSAFDSTDDISRGGQSRGFHLQTANGTMTNPTIEDVNGYGLFGFDVTLVGTGGSITGARRGPIYADIDGFEDPDPVPLTQGGGAVWIASQGAPTFLSWTGGHFEDNIDGGIRTSTAQVELVGNTLVDNGYYLDGPEPETETCNNGIDDNGDELVDCDDPECEFFQNCQFSPDSSIYITGFDPEAFGVPEITDNSITGGAGYAGIYISSAPGGDLSGNTVAAPEATYGVYVNGLGDYDLGDSTIEAEGGMYAAMTLPTELISDDDGDSYAEYQGDCDDTDPDVGGFGATEVAGDLKDNDCDGVTDDGFGTLDTDGDGVTIEDGDCDDDDATRSPDLEEVTGNGIDDNCDGWADFDGDFASPALTLDDTSLTGTLGNGLYLYGSTATLEGESSITGAGTGVFMTSWTWGGTPALEAGTLVAGEGSSLTATGAGASTVQLSGQATSATLTGTTVTSEGGAGITSSNTTAMVLLDGAAIDAAADGISLTGGQLLAGGAATTIAAGDNGVDVAGGASAELQALSVTSAGSAGIAVYGNVVAGAVTIDQATTGVYASAGSFTGGDGLVITNSLGNGVLVDGSGNVTLEGSTITGSGSDGVALRETATASLTDAIIDTTPEYGVSCDGGASDPETSTVTLDACTATVTNATLGEFNLYNGCEEAWSCEAPSDD